MPANAMSLDADQLCDIARAMADWVREGLARGDDRTRCLPTFLPIGQAMPSGLAYVLDLGGSNLRAALVRIGGGRIRLVQGPLGKTMPWQRGKPFARERFLALQTDLLAKLARSRPLPLGYCFSYPARSTPDRDAILTAWTKEIDVPGMVGQKVGRLLVDRLATAGVACNKVTVINDTVAALMAGLHGSPADLHIGLVVGTGANMAALIPATQIPEAATVGLNGWVPVNLESGNFHPPHLNTIDQALDAGTGNPGRQRLEKAVSGAYLGRLLALWHPEAAVDSAAGAIALVNAMAMAHRQPTLAHTARLLYRRSALLTGATLAGLIAFLTEPFGQTAVRVTAEGALMWSRPPSCPAYARLVLAATKQVLRRMDRSGVRVQLCRRAEANLKGAALAALIP